jgi:hypothetical protein
MSPSQRPLPDSTQHSQQTDIHTPVGFELTISAGERPQTYALDRAATGPGSGHTVRVLISLATSGAQTLNRKMGPSPVSYIRE